MSSACIRARPAHLALVPGAVRADAQIADDPVVDDGILDEHVARLVAAGGRVLAVTALADDPADARGRAYAALERIEVEVAGDLDLRGYLGMDEGAPAGYGALRIRVGLTGPEAQERYAELAEAVDAHCPVLDVLSRPIPVERELVL